MSAITSLPRSPVAPPGAAGPVPGNQRIVVRGVGWHVYKGLSNAVGEGQHVRLAYDGKDLELMATSPIHERYKELFGQFVNAVTLALDIDSENVGEATWDAEESSEGSRPTSRTTSSSRSCESRGRPLPASRRNWPTIPNPTWRSRSTRPVPKSTGHRFTPRSRSLRSGGSTVQRSSSSISRPMGPIFRPMRAGSCRSARRTCAAGWSTRTRPGLAWLRRLNEWAQGLGRQA